MANLRFKRVMRLDRDARLFRVCRVMWDRGTVGDGEGYSAKLSLALQAKLIGWNFDANYGWRFIILGIRVQLNRAYGGFYV